MWGCSVPSTRSTDIWRRLGREDAAHRSPQHMRRFRADAGGMRLAPRQQLSLSSAFQERGPQLQDLQRVGGRVQRWGPRVLPPCSPCPGGPLLAQVAADPGGELAGLLVVRFREQWWRPAKARRFGAEPAAAPPAAAGRRSLGTEQPWTGSQGRRGTGHLSSPAIHPRRRLSWRHTFQS